MALCKSFVGISFSILLAVVLWIFFSSSVYACGGTRTELIQYCQPAGCSGGPFISGGHNYTQDGPSVYQGWVEYEDPTIHIFCYQWEIFSSPDCKYNGRLNLGCDATCTIGGNPAQCQGRDAVCAGTEQQNVICTPDYIRTHRGQLGYCQVAPCGFTCNIDRSQGGSGATCSAAQLGAPSSSGDIFGEYGSRASCESECGRGITCIPDSWDPNQCSRCNAQGTGWNFCSDFGPTGATPGGTWCTCAQTCASTLNTTYNSTNYPACFTGSPSTPTPGTGSGGTACPGGVEACGNSAYGELGSCSGSWAYAGITSYDTWCSQQTAGTNPYCYTCITSGGPGGPGQPGRVCTPNSSSYVCRADSCVPGSISTSP